MGWQLEFSLGVGRRYGNGFSVTVLAVGVWRYGHGDDVRIGLDRLALWVMAMLYEITGCLETMYDVLVTLFCSWRKGVILDARITCTL